MIREGSGRALLLALTLAAGGCRPAPAGDSGGAATGDQVGEGRIGSARSHDSLERTRPADTVAATEIHGELGADTTGP